ncbi:MAG: twin-arginine translocase TatA/TatE family subunit [Solirubrobacteraceae bacterium]|jgi:sec-independent protein translocase protein TatA
MGLENPLHIAILVVLLLLIFGAKRLPELGRSLGTGMREFKEGIIGSSEPPPSIESTPDVAPVQARASEDTTATSA